MQSLGVVTQIAGFSVSTHVTGVEIGLLVFAAVIGATLYFLKLKREQNQKLRKAAGTGYHDFDVARYGSSTSGPSLVGSTADVAETRTLAPSFSAPQKGSQRKNRSTEGPPAMPTPFGNSSPNASVPAFDATEAIRQRPETNAAGSPLPTPLAPSGIGTQDPDEEGSALPLLVPPPPPASVPPPPPPPPVG